MSDQRPNTGDDRRDPSSRGSTALEGAGAGAEHLERLAQSFEMSARRWELVVYPTLFAFIILAAYGFYLVYSLANDVSHMAHSVDHNLSAMAANFDNVSGDMDILTVSVGRMANNMQQISRQIEVLDSMSTDMGRMQQSVNAMTRTTHRMRSDMHVMNRAFVRPVSFMTRPVTVMNRFVPW